jgi:hypothetical protein
MDRCHITSLIDFSYFRSVSTIQSGKFVSLDGPHWYWSCTAMLLSPFALMVPTYLS